MNSTVRRNNPLVLAVSALTLATAAVPLAAPAATAAPAGALETCQASYYNLPGNKTASGEMFNPNKLAAAHRTFAFGTKVRVTAPNGKSVTVKINDRGPFTAGRCIDLTPKAFKRLAPLSAGVINNVKVRKV